MSPPPPPEGTEACNISETWRKKYQPPHSACLVPLPRPVWEALRQSACPMELRLDIRATRATVTAQRGRVCERFAFLRKKKVEPRRDGSAGVGLGVGHVMTL